MAINFTLLSTFLSSHDSRKNIRDNNIIPILGKKKRAREERAILLERELKGSVMRDACGKRKKEKKKN